MWHDLIIVQPTDGQVVWARMLYVEQPFQATWNSATYDFTVAGLSNLPWYFVTRWRPT